ncbi:MAG: toll/interleukin-1 receptor domain-containing protein [Leptolyngbyaceae cyanobacterium SM2_3_12]|nr:toll/interleukin-1 receptor domain-containing protein [Leptolyngbyaceae cyanobacterium SM2_3_12]
MAEIFISYSRRDKDFVQVLDQALAASRYGTWVDWDDIPPTADWWKAIEAGIEAAHTCVFVISPDSVASSICRQEIDYAVKRHKRLIPIVRREGFDSQRLHPALSDLNWLFFRQSDDFNIALQKLVEAINTDLDYANTHARLLVRASEWEQKQRSASSLLRGRDLVEAEQWLRQAGLGLGTSPTPLHVDYIGQSRLGETRRQRTLVGTLSALLVTAVGLGLLAWGQRNLAQQRQLEAEANLEAACRQIFGTLEGFAVMEDHGIQFVDESNTSVPVGIIFGQEFIRSAYNTFETDCAEINRAYGWSLDP